jgi:hypothetical protein
MNCFVACTLYRLRFTEKFSAFLQFFPFAPVSEETIMPDSHKSFWKYMQKKTADKLNGF